MRKGFRKTLVISLFFSLLTVMTAQEPSPHGRGPEVRNLNGKLLEAFERLQNLPDNAKASERSHAARVIAERAEALEALIKEDPREAVSLAFSSDLLADLKLEVPDSAEQLESVGEWLGPVNATVADGEDLTSHQTLFSMSTSDGDLNLNFAEEDAAQIESGEVRRIKGVRVRSEVAAMDSGEFTGSMLATSTSCSPIGAQRSIVLMVYMPGTPTPTNTPAAVHDIFFSPTGRSVSEFWRENSHGLTWAEGDVKGWYELDTAYTCDNYQAIRDAAVRAADADVDFSKYNRVFVIIAGMTGDCGWAGIANVGCGSTINSKDGSFTMSTAWMKAASFGNRDQGVKLSIHEGGHSLGLSHASTRGFGAEILGAPNAAGTLGEYGDKFSAMGYWNFGHYAAPHKAKLGWINYQTVTSNGSFSVQPTEYTASLQALKIQRGSDPSQFLWVEFRDNYGVFDSSLNANVFNGALVHYQDVTTGNKTHLLDYTPETTGFDDGMLGGEWTDPYTNLSLDVIPSASALGVNVAYGPTPCVQNNPTVSLSPANPTVNAGNAAIFSVFVKNNDSGSCAPREFNVSSLLPDTWPTIFDTNFLTIAPSSSKSASMTKTAPSGTPAATYAVNAVATNATKTVQGSANLTVAPPVQPITMTLSGPTSPVKTNSSVSVTAVVKQGTAFAAGASVLMTLKEPNDTTTKTITTDSSGKAIWSFKFNPKAVKGTYTVTAQATLGSQTTTATPVTFTLQ